MLIIALLAFLGLHNTPAAEPELPNNTTLQAPEPAADAAIAPVKAPAEARAEMPG
jgi:hypothetical protein